MSDETIAETSHVHEEANFGSAPATVAPAVEETKDAPPAAFFVGKEEEVKATASAEEIKAPASVEVPAEAPTSAEVSEEASSAQEIKVNSN